MQIRLRLLSLERGFREDSNYWQWERTESEITWRKSWSIEIHGHNGIHAKDAEEADWGCCEAALYHLCNVIDFMGGLWWWQKVKCYIFWKMAISIIQGTIGCSDSLLVSSKIIGQVLFEVISEHMKEKPTWNSHYAFTMDKSCLLNLIALWDDIVRPVDGGRHHRGYLPLL